MPSSSTASVMGGDTDGSYHLSWAAVSNASYYQVIITDETGEQRIIKVLGTSYDLAGLSLGSSKVEVQACNASNQCGVGSYAGTIARSRKVTYQHTDMLGTPVMESDESGNVISRSVYEPFGKRLGGEKAGIGYTGHLQDTDLGLTYMQARYYDPLIGRFYSNDPVGYTAKNPVMSFNRYLYVNNNPYKYTDPNGEFLFAPQVGAGIIGFAIGAIAEAVGNENASIGSVMKAGGVGAAVGVATTFGGGLLGTMAVGGAANGLGEVANQAMDGEFNPEGVAEAVAIGTVGGAVAKGAAKIAVAGRGLPNNTATQASHNTTASSSQRVLADSKTLSSTPANRAVAEVKLGGAYGTGAAAEATHQQTQCQNESC
ncbi:Conserved hypothetical protein [Shewanella piezotolerans WP3]|uniref:Teneurin-like YD-shell domain-containing protein n=2 Tax=Shewanella TaxID=22 RepID=B8CT57_SHEPW|nr:Conserved hypothetical protein [Shewanella piezotolerans WP3]